MDKPPKKLHQKVLLHDHLSGSRPMMKILEKLHQLNDKPYPFSGTLEEQHEQVKALFQNPQIDMVKKFANTTGVLQTREGLTLAAETYVGERAKEGFEYCEVMVAPQYYTARGLTPKQVIDAFIVGIKISETDYPKMETNILFTIGREIDADEAVKLVEQAAECDRNYVVGIGLAGDEAAHPPEKHIKMFNRAQDLGFKTTAHAGEWVSAKPNYERDKELLLKNIRAAIFDLKVDRLGHAIPLSKNFELMDYVAKNKIGLEGCPGCNLVSGLIPHTAYLEIRRLLARGVRYLLNSDDDLFMPSLDETFALCDAEYNFAEEEMAQLRRNAWNSRFGHRKKHIED